MSNTRPFSADGSQVRKGAQRSIDGPLRVLDWLAGWVFASTAGRIALGWIIVMIAAWSIALAPEVPTPPLARVGADLGAALLLVVTARAGFLVLSHRKTQGRHQSKQP